MKTNEKDKLSFKIFGITLFTTCHLICETVAEREVGRLKILQGAVKKITGEVCRAV